MLVTAFHSDKARALLAFLAIESDRPHRRETLAGLLWPGYTEASARQSLSQALLSINRLLAAPWTEGPPLFSATRGELQLHSVAVDVDALRFAELIRTFESHRHAPGTLCPACAEGLCEALALYRGDVLDGFSLRDSPAFEEWLLLQRERHHRLAVVASQALAQAQAQDPRPTETLVYARRWAELEPLDEYAHREVMRLLAETGQRSLALAQYESLGRTLRAELGVDPEETTRLLAERIRSGAVGPVSTGGIAAAVLPVAAPAGPEVAPLTQTHNLPAAVDSFVGRERELAEVGELLSARGVRLVTLVGTGGMGKTRLAIETAREVAAESGQEVWLVELASLRQHQSDVEDGVLRAIAAALGAQATSESGLLESVVVALRDRRALLLLDNCEHLLEVVDPLVGALLTRCPRLTILATAREPLRVAGEHVYEVPPLGLPGERREDGIPENALYCDAIRLLNERAGAARYGLCIDETNVGAAVAICRRLDGMPLAIELATARLNALSLQELADRLNGHLTPGGRLHPRWDLLGAGNRAALPRQQTMLATVSWSYDLLGEQERILFDRLSVFAGSFSAAAAEAACGFAPLAAAEVAPVLAELVDCSLVQRVEQGGATRYRLLETLRAYGQERLDERGEAQAVAARHAEYYAAMIDETAPIMRRGEPDYFPTLEALSLDLPELEAAMRWSLAEGDGLAALRIVGSAPFWGVRQIDPAQPRGWALAALERSEHCHGRPAEARLRAWALNTVANHDFVWYDLDEMARTNQAQFEAALVAEDADVLAWAHYNRARLANHESRYADEEPHLRQALALALEGGETGLAAHLQVFLALHAPREQRVAMLEPVLAATPEGFQAYGYQVAANVAWSAGDTTRAERWYRVSVERWSQMGSLRAVGSNRRALSGVLGQLGRLDEAIEQTLQGAEECRRGGDENGRMLGLVQHCVLSWLALRPEAGALLHGLLRDPYGMGPARYGTINRLALLRVAYALGERELGRRLETEALAIDDLSDDAYGRHSLADARGWDAFLNGDCTVAVDCFREAVQAAHPRWRDDANEAREHLAWALAAAGDLDEAAALLAEAASEREAMGIVLYPVEIAHHERAVALVQAIH